MGTDYTIGQRSGPGPEGEARRQRFVEGGKGRVGRGSPPPVTVTGSECGAGAGGEAGGSGRKALWARVKRTRVALCRSDSDGSGEIGSCPFGAFSFLQARRCGRSPLRVRLPRRCWCKIPLQRGTLYRPAAGLLVDPLPGC